jgi:hypothetical protein
MSSKPNRGSRVRGGRGGRGRGGRVARGRVASRAPPTTRYSRFDQEFQAQLDHEDEAFSEKDNIEFLAIVNGAPEEVAETKPGPSKRSASKRKYEVETIDYEEEDEDYEYEAEMKPTRAYNSKKLTADEICSQYIDAFKRSNDLKLNEYFRILNATVKDSVSLLTKEVNTLNSYFRNNSWSGQDKGAKTSRKRIKLENKEEDGELIEIDISSQEYIDSKLSPFSTVSTRKSSRKALPELLPAQSPIRQIEPEFETAQSPLRQVESMLKKAQSPLRQVPTSVKSESDPNSKKGKIKHEHDIENEFETEEKKQEISFSEFNRIVSNSRNHTSCATSLAKALFNRSELASDANVTGVLSNGLPKSRLDPMRIQAIKKASVDRKPTGLSDDEAWTDCIKAIHKFQYDLREERRSFDYK